VRPGGRAGRRASALRRSTSLGVALLAGAALVIPASSEPTPPRPHLLFAIADDWSFGHAGAYGCSWVKTPNFDRVAKDGLLFANAYTPCGKCSPSRASILTGRNPWQLKAAANHWPVFPSEFKTWPEALGGLGYFVGATGKTWAPGEAKDAEGRTRQMAGRPFNARKAPPPTEAIGHNDYAGNFADFLDAAPAGQPWCFWYGSTEPHRDYAFGSGATKGGKQPAEIDRVPGYWPDNETVRQDLLDYAFEVEHFDRHLGRMLDLLEQRGLRSNTLVVVTSDNGMPFPRAKGYAYEESDHLPLAMMWPAGIREPGRKVEDYISFIDFAPTFVAVAGLTWEQTGLAPAAGHSLTDLFANQPARVRDHVLIGKERNDTGRPGDAGYPIRGIVKGGQFYLHNFAPDRWPGGNPETGYKDTDDSPTKTEVLATREDPERKHFWDLCFGMLSAEQFYDLRTDPDALTNLASRLDTTALRDQLFTELKAQADPRLAGQPEVFEAEPYAGPQRGLYERWARERATP
jgi:N-sulfoglucosamine sulfohydrolase